MSDFLALFDLQTLTIWATVVSVSAATIYAIMNLTMKETSFEDAVLQQTGKVIKQPTSTKPVSKKTKKAKQNPKANNVVVQEEVSLAEVVEEKIIVPVKSIPLMKTTKGVSDNKQKSKNAKRTDKEIAIGKGLSREALQIHDLIQELLLSEADTEILVDELTRFSPKLREKNLNKPNKSNKKNDNKIVQDETKQFQVEFDDCKQKLRISDKLVESLSVQSKSLMETADNHKKQIQSLKNETESLRSKEKIPDQRELVKKLNVQITDLNKQVDVQKAKTQGIDVSNMKKQLEIITGELTKSAIKVNAAENTKRMYETRANGLQKKVDLLENSMNEKQNNKSAENELAAKELSSLRAMHEQAESRLTEHLRLQASNKQEYTRTKAGYDNLITENQEKIYALDQLTEEKSRISNDLTNLQNEYTSNNLLLESQHSELKLAHSNIDNMNVELSEQKKKNDILRTRNTSVADSLSAIEKENLILKTDMHKITNSTKSSDKTVAELKALQNCYDEAISNQKMTVANSLSEISELTSNVKSLKTTITLSEDKNKESMAKENKLTVEIKTVKEKMLDIMKENQQLKNNIPDDVGNNRVDKFEVLSNELLIKNGDFEKLLKNLNSEKDDLKKSLVESKKDKETVNTDLSNYKIVLKDTETVLKELQASVEDEEKKWKNKLCSAESENLEKIANLEKCEKKIHSENVKLNGIIRTGKDALLAEQESNKQLKVLLEQHNTASNNGISSITEDHIKTKKRLAIIESLLENERSNNKVLSQKLVSYGCLVQEYCGDSSITDHL